jgi:hypothetical protein
MPAPLEAPIAWGATKVEAAAAAFVARASKVLLLWLPFGRPRFRDVEGAVSGALTSSLLSSDLVIAGSGTAKGRHDRAGLRKERLKMREEARGCP